LIAMLVIGRNGRGSRLVAAELLALRHRVATSRPRSAIAQLEAGAAARRAALSRARDRQVRLDATVQD
jgi:hypothetical protein